MPARFLSLAICFAGFAGIGLEIHALTDKGISQGGAVWAVLRYFTIITNGLLAVIFGIVALGAGRFDHPRVLAWLVAAMSLVGVVYALLLQDLRTLAGATATANFLLHQLNPVLAVLYWAAFVPKGSLSWRDPLVWVLYPLAYLVYALVRGSVDGQYPYPFIDVGTIGMQRVAINSMVIAAAFVGAGEAMVALDRMLAKRTGD